MLPAKKDSTFYGAGRSANGSLYDRAHFHIPSICICMCVCRGCVDCPYSRLSIHLRRCLFQPALLSYVHPRPLHVLLLGLARVPSAFPWYPCVLLSRYPLLLHPPNFWAMRARHCRFSAPVSSSLSPVMGHLICPCDSPLCCYRVYTLL